MFSIDLKSSTNIVALVLSAVPTLTSVGYLAALGYKTVVPKAAKAMLDVPITIGSSELKYHLVFAFTEPSETEKIVFLLISASSSNLVSLVRTYEVAVPPVDDT